MSKYESTKLMVTNLFRYTTIKKLCEKTQYFIDQVNLYIFNSPPPSNK